MKFTVCGSRIVCSRKDRAAADDDVYTIVVEFDAHLQTVPTHVAARLTNGEVAQLKAFMTERQRIQGKPAERNLLEALPGLLEDATDILEQVEQVNDETYRSLSVSIGELNDALRRVKPAHRDNAAPIKNMRKSEAQKERLENIKHIIQS